MPHPKSANSLVIGVDFDNTIVCYDDLFHSAAEESGHFPKGAPRLKNKVRDALREKGLEEEWVRLQGAVYGSKIEYAAPWPGVKDFFLEMAKLKAVVYIISHKTRVPAAGPPYELRLAAMKWLESSGFFENEYRLSKDNVYFETTRKDKTDRIKEMGCTHFIDDLPETFKEPAFPRDTLNILFDPSGDSADIRGVHRVKSWEKITRIITGNRY